IVTYDNGECAFSYRMSRFKGEPGRHVVLSVTFELLRTSLGRPLAYAELARSLGVDVDERAPLGEVRTAVRRLRRGKGMVSAEHDHDTRSAGSVLTDSTHSTHRAQTRPKAAPRWEQ